jgi:hypothetical protein
MRAQKVLPKEFQFYLPDLDNIILVECHEEDTVTIRVTKNNIPEQRKILFVRRLAAEGFIPDQYEWYCGSTDSSNGITWIKDLSWLEIPKVITRRSRAFVCRLLVAACVLWGCMMRVLLVSDDSTNKLTQQNRTGNVVPTNPTLAPQARFLSLVPGEPLPELQGKH